MKLSNLLVTLLLVVMGSYVVMANQDHDNSKQEVKGGVTCILCRQVVSILYKELEKNATRERIENLLARSCKVIYRNKEKQRECEERVHKNAELILNSFLNKVPPEVVCLLAGMCVSNDVSNPTNNFAAKNSPLKVEWCSLCQRTYPILSEIVQIDEFKENLRDIGHNFCNASILPINVKECNRKVDVYIKVLSTVSDATEGCKKVDLCPDKVDFKFLSNYERYGNWWDDFKCSTCKMLVKGIYEQLDEAVHDPATKDLINRICEHIHEDDLKEKCKVDAYHALETLVKDFKENLPPQPACEQLDYCKKKESLDRSADLELLGKRSVCRVCKLVYPAAHKVLGNKKIREASLNITRRLCNRVPSKDKCVKAVSDLINNLADGKTSDQGCATLCQKKSIEMLSSFQFNQCTICQTSMIAVRHFFDSELVKTRLNETLEQLCDSQNKEQAKRCKEIVRANLPKFYERIHNLTDHDTGFCVQMGYCEKPHHIELTSLPVEAEDTFKSSEILMTDDERKFY